MTDATLTSWIDVPAGHDFPLANLPFGIFSTPAAAPTWDAFGRPCRGPERMPCLGFLNDVEVNAEVLAAPV